MTQFRLSSLAIASPSREHPTTRTTSVERSSLLWPTTATGRSPSIPPDTLVDGRRAYPRLHDVPHKVDGVIVMVTGDAAAEIVDDADAVSIKHVWLFKGIGGAGAVSAASLAACERHGIDPVAGACPLMFLEPVTAVHRIHRSIRHHRGDVEKVDAG
jgi:hypothetical protein